jgi:glycosyltransferase involved in cell wall biosynthesis
MDATKNTEARPTVAISEPETHTNVHLSGAPETKQGSLNVHFAPADEGGTSFHWHRVPSKCINEGGFGNASVHNIFDHTADIIILQRQLNPAIIEGIKWIQSLGKPVLYQIEDQVWHLPFHSPVKAEYHPKALEGAYKIINACDGIIVSSDALKRFLSPHNDNIYVLPHILLRKWETRWQPKTERNDDEVRIIWTTTGHHSHDFPIIEHVFKDIANKYDNVKIILWGFITQNMLTMVPLEKMEYYGWVGIEDYFRCLTAMEADIGVAPLDINDTYNKCKTPLKFLEYGLMHTAPVVSDIEPYACVEHEKTGMVVHKNKHKYWVDHLSRLIEDKEFRHEIADNAHQYWLDNHTEDAIIEYMRIFHDTIKKKAKGKST